MTAFDNILKRMANQEILLPIFENQMRMGDWPERYTIEIDSSPYYGTGDGYFHPSTHSLMDERQLYYLFHPRTRKFVVDEPFSLQREMTVAVGTSLHAVIQTMMVMTGLLEEKNIEKIFVIEDHHVRGKIDMIVDHPTFGPIVVEIKSRTHYKFHKTIEPLPEWEAQLSIQLDAVGLEKGLILMAETGYPFRLKEIPVARNDALLSTIYAKFDRVREAIALDRPPEYCCAPNSATASNCPVRFACWMNPNGPQ